MKCEYCKYTAENDTKMYQHYNVSHQGKKYVPSYSKEEVVKKKKSNV